MSTFWHSIIYVDTHVSERAQNAKPVVNMGKLLMTSRMPFDFIIVDLNSFANPIELKWATQESGNGLVTLPTCPSPSAFLKLVI